MQKHYAKGKDASANPGKYGGLSCLNAPDASAERHECLMQRPLLLLSPTLLFERFACCSALPLFDLAGICRY